MNEDWDFYQRIEDGRPLSVYLDLVIAEEAPLAELPVLAWLRMELCRPRADGLADESELDALDAIEDALSELDDDHTRYVGRSTGDGYRDFYFYASQAGDWPQRVARAMSAFTDYRYVTGSRDDPEWQLYRDVLYPVGEDFERVQNRRACEALEQNGDDLATPREIDHWVYFADAAARAECERQADRLGFRVRARLAPQEDDERLGLQLYRIDIPQPQRIDEVTLPLYRAVQALGGDYDGWESQVVG